MVNQIIISIDAIRREFQAWIPFVTISRYKNSLVMSGVEAKLHRNTNEVT